MALLALSAPAMTPDTLRLLLAGAIKNSRSRPYPGPQSYNDVLLGVADEMLATPEGAALAAAWWAAIAERQTHHRRYPGTETTAVRDAFVSAVDAALALAQEGQG